MAQTNQQQPFGDSHDGEDALFSPDQKQLKQALRNREKGCRVIGANQEQTKIFRMLVDTETNEEVLFSFISDLAEYFENDQETCAFLQPYLRRVGRYYSDVVREEKKGVALAAYTLAASLAAPKTKDRIQAEDKIKFLLQDPGDFSPLIVFEAVCPILDTLLADEEYSTDGAQHFALNEQIDIYEAIALQSFQMTAFSDPEAMYWMIDSALANNYILPVTVYRQMSEWLIVELDEMTSHARPKPNHERISNRFFNSPQRLKSSVHRGRIISCDPKNWNPDGLQARFNTLAKAVDCLGENDPQADAYYTRFAQQLALRVQQKTALAEKMIDLQKECLAYIGPLPEVSDDDEKLPVTSAMRLSLSLLDGYAVSDNYGSIFRLLGKGKQKAFCTEHRNILKDAPRENDPYGHDETVMTLTEYALSIKRNAENESNVLVTLAAMDNMFDIFCSQENAPPVKLRMGVLEHLGNNSSNDPRICDWADQRLCLLALAVDSMESLSHLEQVAPSVREHEVKRGHKMVAEVNLLAFPN